MLAVTNLSYFIGDRPIYKNANLHIKSKDKIGLIGLNGTGKSTLLKLIDGDLTPDEGEISKSKDCTIGFLNQDLLSYESDNNIVDVAMEAFHEAVKAQKQINQLLVKMEKAYEAYMVDKLAKLQERFESLNGYQLQAMAEEILEGVGFKTEELKKPLSQFSGGWRMRVMLAKLLLSKPSLLLLDEPTNHLDLPSIEWIENYIKNYDGAVVIVSHDQEFLDNTVNTIVEVSQQQLVSYAGNYEFYLKEKALRESIQQGAYENQQQKIKQTERFIDRFRAKASKAKQVQSRIKALEKIEKVDPIQQAYVGINFNFQVKQKSGRHVLHLEGISKAYGSNSILKNTSAQIERGDKIALIGANGKGKSTLLRIIANIEDFEGKRTLGHNTQIALYAQHQLEALTIENEMLEELKQAGSDKTELELRNLLGCFLFNGDDVFKKIKVLSGGEKSRVALAKVLLSEANFLLLDEPTNHLDFISIEMLIQTIRNYEGTSVIISHNRHFIASVANKIWFIEDEAIKEYPGTYNEFIEWNEKRKNNISKEVDVKPVVEKKTRNHPPKNNNSEVKKAERELEKIEKEIEHLEKKKKEVENALAMPEVYNVSEKLNETNKIYINVKKHLEYAHHQWEELILLLERLEDDANT